MPRGATQANCDSPAVKRPSVASGGPSSASGRAIQRQRPAAPERPGHLRARFKHVFGCHLFVRFRPWYGSMDTVAPMTDTQPSVEALYRADAERLWRALFAFAGDAEEDRE